MIINETQTINKALKSAHAIGSKLNTSILFLDSQGNNNYAYKKLDNKKLKLIKFDQETSIKSKKSPNKWHLYTQWDLRDSWQLLKQVFHQSGFFVFLIFISKVMIELGQLLDNIIQCFQGKTDIIYLPSPSEWLIPNWNGTNTVELLFIIGFVIYQTFHISLVKHIYLNQNYIKFAINNKIITKLKMQDVKLTLFFSHPFPEIVILSSEKAIIINQFNPKIGQELLVSINQGIDFFQNK